MNEFEKSQVLFNICTEEKEKAVHRFTNTEANAIYDFGDHIVQHGALFTDQEQQLLMVQVKTLWDDKPVHWESSLGWSSVVGKLGEAWRLLKKI